MKSSKHVGSLMSVVLLAGALAGCANSNGGSPASSNQTTSAKTDKPVQFSYLRPVWGTATYQKGGPYEKELFAKGNVQIDAQIIPVKEYNAKVNAIIASGSIPDVMWGSGPFSSVFREAQEQGAYLKINQYLDKYPAVKKAIPDSIWNQLKDKNGDIYFIPNPVSPYVPFMLMYRQDWFEKLNIPEPKTTDELIAALDKIKNSDPDGNGKNDTIPLTIGTRWYLKDLATSFGASHDGWEPSKDDPNKIVPPYASEKQINFNFWLQDLSKKGLLDPDFGIVLDQNKAYDKFKTGKTAVFPNNYINYLNVLTDLKKADPNAKIGIFSPLTGPDGTKGGVRTIVPMDRGLYISSKAKDPEGIFRFLNWQLTDGNDMRRYGIEGKTYKVLSDGSKEEIIESERDPAYQKSQIEPLGTMTPYDEALPNWDNYKRDFEKNGFGDKYEYYKKKYDEYLQNKYPDYRNPAAVSQVEMKEGSKLYEDHLKSTVEGAAINYKLTKQDWLGALKKWEDAGGAKLIEDVNTVQKDKSKPKME